MVVAGGDGWGVIQGGRVVSGCGNAMNGSRVVVVETVIVVGGIAGIAVKLLWLVVVAGLGRRGG